MFRTVAAPIDYGVTAERLADLREAAQGARAANYAPYSKFMVLAAIETSHGVFGGSNVENVNFTLTKHAEEVAILAAILAGAGPRGGWIKTLYVTGASPCGSCRQFTFEFARPQTVVLIDRVSQSTVRRASLPGLSDRSVEAWRLSDLLPDAFGPVDLKRS
jgi:cytidine deaminase